MFSRSFLPVCRKTETGATLSRKMFGFWLPFWCIFNDQLFRQRECCVRDALNRVVQHAETYHSEINTHQSNAYGLVPSKLLVSVRNDREHHEHDDSEGSGGLPNSPCPEVDQHFPATTMDGIEMFQVQTK